MYRCAIYLVSLALALSTFPPRAPAQSSISTTQDLSVSLAPNAKLSLPAQITLTRGAGIFQPFTASTPLNYRVRTNTGNGSAQITLRTSEFTPAGGPSLAAGDLRLSCTGSLPVAQCLAQQAVPANQNLRIAQFGAGACTGGGSPCSAADPATLNLQFTLDNSPTHITGQYTATLLFTISSP